MRWTLSATRSWTRWRRLSPGTSFCGTQRIDPASTVIGLLPGSRRKEIVTLLPDFLAAAERLVQNLPGKYVFLVPRAPTVSPQLLLDNGISRLPGPPGHPGAG